MGLEGAGLLLYGGNAYLTFDASNILPALSNAVFAAQAGVRLTADKIIHHESDEKYSHIKRWGDQLPILKNLLALSHVIKPQGSLGRKPRSPPPNP
jgi:hypothetical protein